MFSHIMIGARELEAMVAFYDAVLAPKPICVACKLVSQHHREKRSTLPGLQRSGRAHLMKGCLVSGRSTRKIFTPLTVAILRETNSVLLMRKALRPNCRIYLSGSGNCGCLSSC